MIEMIENSLQAGEFLNLTVIILIAGIAILGLLAAGLICAVIVGSIIVENIVLDRLKLKGKLSDNQLVGITMGTIVAVGLLIIGIIAI